MRFCLIVGAVLLAGCNAHATLPGMGPLTLHQFTIVNMDAQVYCRGGYEHIGGALKVTTGVLCDDGRRGRLDLTTRADGPPVAGLVRLCDGMLSSVAFSPISEHHFHGKAPSLNRIAVPDSKYRPDPCPHRKKTR